MNDLDNGSARDFLRAVSGGAALLAGAPELFVGTFLGTAVERYDAAYVGSFSDADGKTGAARGSFVSSLPFVSYIAFH